MTNLLAIVCLRIVLVILLIGVLYQDLRERKLSVWILVMTAIVAMAIGFSEQGEWKSFVVNTATNIAFIFIQTIVISGYIIFRFQVRITGVLTFIGFGDLLFWFAVCPLIIFPVFIMHFIASLLLAMILHVVFYRFSFYGSKTVPLAGMQSLYYVVMLLIEMLPQYK